MMDFTGVWRTAGGAYVRVRRAVVGWTGERIDIGVCWCGHPEDEHGCEGDGPCAGFVGLDALDAARCRCLCYRAAALVWSDGGENALPELTLVERVRDAAAPPAFRR
jgi:hypothetical protein